MLVYRKNKKNGNWDVFGPVAELQVGPVTVTKKDGSTKQETVLKISKPFNTDDKGMCAFGYLTSPTPQASQPSQACCDVCKQAVCQCLPTSDNLEVPF